MVKVLKMINEFDFRNLVDHFRNRCKPKIESSLIYKLQKVDERLESVYRAGPRWEEELRFQENVFDRMLQRRNWYQPPEKLEDKRSFKYPTDDEFEEYRK